MSKTPYKLVIDTATEFFGDYEKALSWWMKKDIHFGYKSPFELAKEGKGRQLIKFFEALNFKYKKRM